MSLEILIMVRTCLLNWTVFYYFGLYNVSGQCFAYVGMLISIYSWICYWLHWCIICFFLTDMSMMELWWTIMLTYLIFSHACGRCVIIECKVCFLSYKLNCLLLLHFFWHSSFWPISAVHVSFLFYSLQSVDHPYLVVYSATAALRNEGRVNNDINEQVCGICHEPAEDAVVSWSFLQD